MGITDIITGKEIYKCNNCDVGSGYFSADGLMMLAYPEPRYVDKNGKECYDTYADGTTIKNSLIAFQSDKGKYGFYKYTLSKYGNGLYEREIIPAKYDTAYQTFYDDLGTEIFIKGYFVAEISGKKGLVDSLGNEVTPIKYDWIDCSFLGSEYVKVKVNGQFGFLDKSGKEVVAPAYYEVGNFSEGLARVQLKQTGNFGYIDKTGVTIIPLKYTLAEDFINGKAKIQLDNREFYIDTNGKEVE
jgi:hypothetical protein